jgi:hypothetical protein
LILKISYEFIKNCNKGNLYVISKAIFFSFFGEFLHCGDQKQNPMGIVKEPFGGRGK